jgi:hypothetical protein
MRKLLSILFVLVLISLPVLTVQGQQAPAGAAESRVAGRVTASQYNYGIGSSSPLKVLVGNTATGSATVTLFTGTAVLPSGATIAVLNVNAPITIGIGANVETVTPTAVSSCNIGALQGTCSVTATFANTHGSGEPIFSGTAGLQEAINDAFQNGGGLVVIDNLWQGTNTIITAAVPYANVSIEDMRNGTTRFWNATPTGAALAIPTTLTGQTACDATHQFCSDATVAGSASYAGGSLFGCVAYVDIMGNEGPCSLTASFTDVSAKAIDVAAPAASPGAVGYVVYLSLDAGTYAQAYQIPSTSLNCTLTTLEKTTPACAVANTTYGQSVSTFGAAGLFTKGGSQITTISLNTGQHFTSLGSLAMTAASMVPITNSSVTYSYAPSNRMAAPGISSANVVNYAASGSSATTIPNAIATWTIPAGSFNFIGAEFRVSGFFTFTDGGDTSDEIRIAWDAPGTNTTTIPIALCALKTTATGAAAAQNGTYSCTVKVATVGATGTALVNGWGDIALAAGQTTLVRSSLATAVAPSSSINLTAPARIVVYYIGTGATNNPGAQGLQATLEVLN